MECDTCRTKLGSPILCSGCLSNRKEIERLNKRLIAKYQRTHERKIIEHELRHIDEIERLQSRIELLEGELKLYRPDTTSLNHCCPACGREYGLRRRIELLEAKVMRLQSRIELLEDELDDALIVNQLLRKDYELLEGGIRNE